MVSKVWLTMTPHLVTLTPTTGWLSRVPELLLPGALGGVAAGQPFIDKAVGNRTSDQH